MTTLGSPAASPVAVAAAPYHMRARAEIDRTLWGDLVETSDESWMWHLPDMVDVFAAHAGLQDLSFGVTDHRGRLCAVMPLYFSSRRRARILTHRYLESIGGPACAAGIDRVQRKRILASIREHLARLLDEHDAERVSVTTSALARYRRGPEAPRVSPLVEAGFANADTATWVIDLAKSTESIRAAYASGTKYELKRAAREPFTLREPCGARDLETWHDLHRETNARTGRGANRFEFLQAIYERFVATGRARVLFFERKGRVVAAQTTALYKGGAYYWFGPSASERSGGETRVLMDEQIMHAKRQGCVLYETGDAAFVGQNAKSQGISKFKASFGATLVPRYNGRLLSPRFKFRLMRAVHELTAREIP